MPLIIGLPALRKMYLYVVMIDRDSKIDATSNPYTCVTLDVDNATSFIWVKRSLVWI